MWHNIKLNHDELTIKIHDISEKDRKWMKDYFESICEYKLPDLISD